MLAVTLSAVLGRSGLATLEGTAAEILRWAGLLLYAAGVGLRRWAARSLGPWFTRDLEVSEEQPLISSGPYRYLRHPLYSGLLLIGFGMSLLFANLLAPVLAGLLVAQALRARIRREEQLLSLRYGSAYRQFMATRAGLLPPLW